MYTSFVEMIINVLYPIHIQKLKILIEKKWSKNLISGTKSYKRALAKRN